MAQHVACGGHRAELAFSGAGRVPARLATAIAKARTSMAVPLVASTAHALHGAIGITEEYDLQLYTRRLHEWRMADGSETYWNAIVGEALLAQAQATVADFARAALVWRSGVSAPRSARGPHLTRLRARFFGAYRLMQRRERKSYEQFLQYQQDGHIVTLTLNEPDRRNPLTGNTAVQEFLEAIERIEDDRSVRAVIVTGAGTAFSSGGNIRDMERHASGEVAGMEIRQDYRRGIQRLPLALFNLEVPVIAAVNGAAIGAGLDLACMCDIRIASEDAASPRASSSWASFPATAARGCCRASLACRVPRS